jgi:hypothetical protein
VVTQAMQRKLKRAGRRSRYRLRKQIVEPVLGQIKEPGGFRQFLLRGIEKSKLSGRLICTAHNLKKLGQADEATMPNLPLANKPSRPNTAWCTRLLAAWRIGLIYSADGAKAGQSQWDGAQL